MSTRSWLPGRRVLVCALALTPIVLQMPATSRAAIFSWAYPASGTTNTTVNWSPVGLPGALDDTRYWQNASYGITVSSPADTASTVWMSNGGTPKFVGGTLRIANSFTVDGGSATSVTSGFVRAGWFSIGPGSLTITGSTTQARSTYPGATDYVGTASGLSSSLAVNGGAFFQTGAIVVPEYQGDIGTLTVAGHPFNSPASTLRSVYTGTYSTYQGDIVIGTQGTGDFELSNGGFVHTDGDLLVGTNGVGTVHVFHSGTYLNNPNPSLEVDGYAYVAENTFVGNGTDTYPGGSGLFQMDAGYASLWGMFLGDENGSSGGTLRMLGGTLVVNDGIVMSKANDGQLDLRGGTVRVTGRDNSIYYDDFPMSLNQAGPITISSQVGSPVLALEGGGTNSISSASPTALMLGRGGAGTLHMALSGLQVFGGVVIADSLAGTGAVQEDSASALNVYGPVTVGPGNGALSLLGGSNVSASGETDIAASATTAGALTVTQRSYAHCLAGLAIGGTLGASTPGNVVALVDTSSFIEDDGPTTRVWKNAGHLMLRDTSAAYLQNLYCSGEVGLATGQVKATSVHLFDTGSLHGTGQVAGAVALDDSTALLAILAGDPAGGALVAGDSTVTTGFRSSGLARVEQDTLVLLCKGGVPLGHVQLAGGTLRLPNGGHVRVGDLLEGAGRLEGDVLDDGTVDADAGGNINVAGHLTCLTGAITGATLAVLPGGRLSARGSLAATLTLGGGLDMGPTPARLTLGGSATLLSTDALTMRAGSLASGVQDTLVLTAPIVLHGTLDVRTILASPPVAGDTLTLVSGPSISGTFDSMTLNGNAPAGFVGLVYEPTRVRLAVLKNTAGVDPGPQPALPVALRFAALGGPHDGTLALDLPREATVRADLLDVSGRRVMTLENSALAAGDHRYVLDPALPSGVYFARAEVVDRTGLHVLTARCVRVR